MRLRRAMAIALGAMLGAGTRWAAIQAFGESSIEEALLGVNVAGCFVFGLISGVPASELGPRARDLLGAGLCGSLTTWSGVAVETATRVRAGEWFGTSSVLASNLALGIGAAVLGRALAGRRWTAAP